MFRDTKTLLTLGALALVVYVAARANTSGLTPEEMATRHRSL